jgi:GNAT superfamily N-acetyltransferase
MEFQISYDLNEFKKYYRSLRDLHAYYATLGRDTDIGVLGIVEERHIKNNPNHLVIWKNRSTIIGHAIWHESNTEEHIKSDPRDESDQRILRNFLQGNGEFVELHELWLRTEFRGQGFGQRFFNFFEDFIRKQGFPAIVFYTDNPAAAAICRKRGYQEDFLTDENWLVFYLSLNLA